VIATQRLSKLHKDAAAETNNVIIGRTWLDADVGQGEFYAFGPALGQPGVVHFRSDQVRTTHPRPGQRHLLTAPAPSRAIRGVLGKFADLPHEVEEEIRGLDEAPPADRRVGAPNQTPQGREWGAADRSGGRRARR
jgi:hypothetical protein